MNGWKITQIKGGYKATKGNIEVWAETYGLLMVYIFNRQ